MHLVLPFVAIAAASSLHAQTQFTFSGTIGSTSTEGLTVGTPVTFTFVTSGNPSAAKSGDAPYFVDYDLARNVDLFQSISGTGVTGTWVRPTSNGGYTELALDRVGSQYFSGSGNFYLWTDIVDAVGGNQASLSFFGLELYNINFNLSVLETLPAYPNTYNYAGLWSAYYGTYSIDPQNSEFSLTTRIDGSGTNFAMTTLTIGPASPVPESSTYGLALGGLALVAVALRRRNKTKA